MGAQAADGSQLVRSDCLPLEVVATPVPGSEQLLRWNADNLELLHAVAAIDELPREAREDHGPVAVELAKLDAKLRLILRLLGRQMAGSLPPPHPVRIGSARLQWTGPAPAAPGGHAIARLYLSPLVMEPLSLPGRLGAPAADGSGRTWQALQYEGLSNLVVAALEKHIFLHHRRAVAQSRPAQGG